MLLPSWRSFHHFNCNPAIGSNASWKILCHRVHIEVEMKIRGLYLLSQLERTLRFVRDGNYRVKGGGRAPSPPAARVDFSIMMECTPEIGYRHSVCTLCLFLGISLILEGNTEDLVPITKRECFTSSYLIIVFFLGTKSLVLTKRPPNLKSELKQSLINEVSLYLCHTYVSNLTRQVIRNGILYYTKQPQAWCG